MSTSPNYGIHIELVDDDWNVIASETIPTVSYEQGAEALSRLVKYFEKKQAEAEQRAEDQNED